MSRRRSVRTEGAWRLVTAGLGVLLAVAMSSNREASAGVNVWTSHGPDGGDAWSLVALPGSPTRLLAGTTSGSGAPKGGIWVSADAGAGWRLVSDLGDFQRVDAFVTDPSDPSVIYAVTRRGILKSSDRGEHWISLGGVATGALAIAPSRLTTIYAVALDNGWLLRSEDGAVSWQSVGSHLPAGTEVTSVAVQPDSESTVFVGTVGNGVLKTTDGGETWTAASGGLPSTPQDRITFLACDFHTPAGLLAVVVGSSNRASLYRSSNGGTDWTEIPLPIAPESISCVALSRRDPALINLTTGQVALRSTDDGAHWSMLPIPLPSNAWIRALAVDPADPAVLYAGISGGTSVLKSTDGGEAWTPSASGIAGSSVKALALGRGPDAMLRALVQTARNGAELFSSEDHGGTWQSRGEVSLCGFPETMVVDPANPDIIYAGGSGGPVKSIDSGRSWASSKEGFDRVVSWVHSLAIDPSNPRVLYAGSKRVLDAGRWWGELVYKTTNGAATWQVVSSNMPSDPISTTPRVNAVAVDPRAPSTVYAGGTQLWRSTEAGRHWVALSAAGGAPLPVSAIAVDARGRAFCSAGGVVARTTDGGSSWSRSFPPGGAEALALDPVNPDVIYAGGYGGVSMSLNGGTTWTLMSAGLTGVSVTALAIDGTGTVLHAATDGFGVFDLELSTAAPGLSLVPVTLAMQAGTSAAVVVVVDPPQVTDSELSARSSDREVASVPAVVTLPAGESSVPLAVTAGMAVGRAVITVQLPGALGGLTATVDVTVAPAPHVPRKRLRKT